MLKKVFIVASISACTSFIGGMARYAVVETRAFFEDYAAVDDYNKRRVDEVVRQLRLGVTSSNEHQLGKDVCEHVWGDGYRLYYGLMDGNLVLLGYKYKKNEKTQQKHIRSASMAFWLYLTEQIEENRAAAAAESDAGEKIEPRSGKKNKNKRMQR